MSNHAVVVLETTDRLPLSLKGADNTCLALCQLYPDDYPRGLKVTARLTSSKAIFTVTGRWEQIHDQLVKLGAALNPGPASTVTVYERVLTVKSCTIIPAPPKPSRVQNTPSAPFDDGYNQMMELVFKMATLSLQSFDS